MSSRKIGFFGGTFDPPHSGHLGLAREAREKAGLDQIVFIPTGTPKYKMDVHGVSGKGDRLQMLELLVRDERWAGVSTIELYRDGDTYTSDTVIELKKMYPEDELYYIVGSDSLKNMKDWHEPEVVFSTLKILVLLRDNDTWDSIQGMIGYYKHNYNADITVVMTKRYNISSTQLRERIAAGRDVSDYIPQNVLWYIGARGLYSGGILGRESGSGFNVMSQPYQGPSASAKREVMKVNDYLENYLKTNFDGEKLTSGIVTWIRDWFEKNGKDCAAVVGLSGGKDSTMTATLLRLALGQDRVFGLLMPDHAQSDIGVARAVAHWLGISYCVVNIGQTTDAVKESMLEAELKLSTEGLNIETETHVAAKDGRLVSSSTIRQSPQTLLNIAPRIRMTTLYAIAQSINGRVANTCNRSENYVGYSTIFGDAAGDFSPLHNLTVTEIIRLGEFLEVPPEYIHKKPADGLSGKTDEDVLGFTYEALDTYILTGICEDKELREKIEKRHRANQFKLKYMDTYEP